MKLKSLAASAALALATVGMVPAAHAGFVEDLGVLGPVAKSFGNSFGAFEQLSFNDYYSFRIDDTSKVIGGTLDLYLGLWGVDVESVSVKRQDTASWKTDSTLSDGFSFADLGAGLYDMKLSGDVGLFGGSYKGAIQAIASAAPEPEAYLMMLMGLAGVGWVSARRKAARGDR